MKSWTAFALALALVLPACASMGPQEGSKKGDDWYAGDPTGKKESVS